MFNIELKKNNLNGEQYVLLEHYDKIQFRFTAMLPSTIRRQFYIEILREKIFHQNT